MPAAPMCSSRADAYARAQRYAATLNPAIQGNNGSGTTFAACLKLLTHFPGLTEAELLSVLWEVYNPTCQPPWSLYDLRRKVQDAACRHSAIAS
jgi:hypothetical protein